MSAQVYQGAIAPEAYTLDITPGTVNPVDLSTVSAATLSVRKPDGTVVAWAATISNQTTSTITLTHTFLTGDIALLGDYAIVASLTIPSGTVRAKTAILTVLGKFSRTA